MFMKCHYSTSGTKAVKGKMRFQQMAASHGSNMAQNQ
jgi:hypothetical protein